MELEKSIGKILLVTGVSMLAGGCIQSKLAYDKEMPQAKELAVLLGKEFEADGATPITAEAALSLLTDKPMEFWEQRARMQNMPRLQSYRYNQQIRSYHNQRR